MADEGRPQETVESSPRVSESGADARRAGVAFHGHTANQCFVLFNLHSNPYPFFMTWHFQVPLGFFGLLEISMKGCFPIRKRVGEQTQALRVIFLPARAPCGKGHSSGVWEVTGTPLQSGVQRSPFLQWAVGPAGTGEQ